MKYRIIVMIVIIVLVVFIFSREIFSNTTSKFVEIRLSAVGDCTIGFDSTKISPKIAYTSKGSDLSYYFKNVVSILSKDDLTIANCETTFTDKIEKRKKSGNPVFHFKASPKYAEVFKLGSVEFVSTANNHTFDYGNAGYADTKLALDRFGIKYFGNGEICFFEKQGIKIALISYSLLSKDYKTEGKKIVVELAKLSKVSNLQIISLHWGQEKMSKPIKSQVWLGHYLIDNGADLILGHHPHVIESIETYKGKSIVYSLANFSYGGHTKPCPETFIYQHVFKFEDKKLKNEFGSVIPCLMYSGSINNYQPVVATGKKADEIRKFLLEK